MERRTPTRRPAGAVLARGEPSEPRDSPGQHEPQGHAAEGFRSAPPARPQWQRCQCRADFSPRQATRGAGSPGIEDWPAAPVRIDAAAAERLPACPPCSPPAISSLIQPGPPGGCSSLGLSRGARAGARGGEAQSPVAVRLPTTETGCRGLPRAWLLGQTPNEPPAGPQ